jgi:hypothetical protein
MVSELLLGDNPFIGVSHLAQEKAREEKKDSFVENNAKVVEAAVEGGATGFTFTAHPANLKLLTYLRAHNEALLNSMSYYILVPHAQSYVARANVEGTPRLIGSTLRGASIIDLLAMVVSLKPERAAQSLIRREIAPYLEVLPREKVKAVLLHEVLTEVVIAFSLTQMIEQLGRWAEELGLGFGLETRNFSYLSNCMRKWNLYPVYVMTPLNPLGYQMAANKQAVEAGVKELATQTKLIAINILASGAIDLDQAMEYLRKYKDSIHAVVSASTKPARIRENFLKLKTSLVT